MFIEDILRKAVYSGIMYDAVLSSIMQQIEDGRQITTRQAFMVKSILRKNIPTLSLVMKVPESDVIQFLDDNQWRGELRTLVERRSEVRHLGSNLLGFSYSSKPEITSRMSILLPAYRNDLHIVHVTGFNINKVIDFIGAFAFEMDDATEQYLALCLSSSKSKSSIVMVDDQIGVANIADNEMMSCFMLEMIGARLA